MKTADRKSRALKQHNFRCRPLDHHSPKHRFGSTTKMAAAEVVGLYRTMQKSARRFTNYNVREYVWVNSGTGSTSVDVDSSIKSTNQP